jgi:hypothetical protein
MTNDVTISTVRKDSEMAEPRQSPTLSKDSIETAYSFLHQKRNVYIHSSLEWQKDDIEYAISSYVDDMNRELYDNISNGRDDFLRDHKRFQEDITLAVAKLEEML